MPAPNGVQAQAGAWFSGGGDLPLVGIVNDPLRQRSISVNRDGDERRANSLNRSSFLFPTITSRKGVLSGGLLNEYSLS
jgi:hypothetical protein